MPRALVTTALICAVPTLSCVATADFRFVPAEFATIQAAIDGSDDGDTIVVASGTWSGPGFVDLDVVGRTLTITALEIGGVVLDCDASPNDNIRGFNVGPGSDLSLVGLEIANARTNVRGAGVFVDDARVELIDCRIVNCWTDINGFQPGGGIAATGSASEVILLRTRVEDCFAVTAAGILIDGGQFTMIDSEVRDCDAFGNSGGIRLVESDGARIVDSIVAQCAADSGGGGLGIRNSQDVVIQRSTFASNVSTDPGAGILIDSDSSATISDSLIESNISSTFTSGIRADGQLLLRRSRIRGNEAMFGSAVTAIHPDSRIENCVFDSNSGSSGAAISAAASVHIINCTVVANAGSDVGAGGISGGTIINCIVQDNTTPSLLNPASVQYSNIQGGAPGPGNIDQLPVFADADFRLAAGSPGIDAGDSLAVATEADFDGRLRRIDDPSTDDTGIPAGPNMAVVDMGAYERNICPADIDGSGAVTFEDLLVLIAEWGPVEPCDNPPCNAVLADINANGVVDISDLLGLLATTGQCSG